MFYIVQCLNIVFFEVKQNTIDYSHIVNSKIKPILNIIDTISYKAIPSGIPISGPLPHQFLAMYYFDYYWYCACVILFNAHCEAHGFWLVKCLYTCKNCMVGLY